MNDILLLKHYTVRKSVAYETMLDENNEPLMSPVGFDESDDVDVEFGISFNGLDPEPGEYFKIGNEPGVAIWLIERIKEFAAAEKEAYAGNILRSINKRVDSIEGNNFELLQGGCGGN